MRGRNVESMRVSISASILLCFGLLTGCVTDDVDSVDDQDTVTDRKDTPTKVEAPAVLDPTFGEDPPTSLPAIHNTHPTQADLAATRVVRPRPTPEDSNAEAASDPSWTQPTIHASDVATQVE